LKTQAPFWKRARRPDGSVENWIEAKASDDRSAARWRAADSP
jgi:molybdopterin synthase catalytic subunit